MKNNLVAFGDEKEGFIIDLNTISGAFKDGSMWKLYRTDGHAVAQINEKYYAKLLTHISSRTTDKVNEENKKLRQIIKDITGCDYNFSSIELATTVPTAPISVENLEKLGRQHSDVANAELEGSKLALNAATAGTAGTAELDRLKLALKAAEVELANVHSDLEKAKGDLASFNARAKANDSLLIAICRERDELRQQVANAHHVSYQFKENVIRRNPGEVVASKSRRVEMDEAIAILKKARTECNPEDYLILDLAIIDPPGVGQSKYCNSNTTHRTSFIVD